MFSRLFCTLCLIMVSVTSGCSLYSGVARHRQNDEFATRELARQEMSVVIAADPLFRALPGWEGRARRAVEKVSEKWQNLFGISFTVIDVVTWNPPFHTLLIPIIGEYYALDLVGRDDADLIIGVTLCSGMGFSGLTSIRGRYVMACSSPTASLAHVIDHEIAHTFGAEHTWLPSTESALLIPWPFQAGWYFEDTKDTIRATAREKLGTSSASAATTAPSPAAAAAATGDESVWRLPQPPAR